MYCKKCGALIEEGVGFCSACGEPIAATIVGPSQKRSINVAQLVWAIISMSLCFPLGAAALIFTIMAQDAKTDEEEKTMVKRAKICNIIATVFVAVSIAFFFGVLFLPLLFVGAVA